MFVKVSTKAKITIQYSSPLILWTKWQNSYLQDHLHLEILWNTLSHKSVNKNNRNGAFIWLILSNIHSKLLLLTKLTWLLLFFLIYIRSGKAIGLQCWCWVAGISSLFHMFPDSTVKFKPYWQTGFLLLSSQNNYLTSTVTIRACEIDGEEKWAKGCASLFKHPCVRWEVPGISHREVSQRQNNSLRTYFEACEFWFILSPKGYLVVVL